MSELSEREAKAGISRKALETLRRRAKGNGSSATTITLEEHLAQSHNPAEKAGKAIPVPEKTTVIDTWNRSLDLINVNGWTFQIRETTHFGRTEAIILILTRIELEHLARKIDQVLIEPPQEGRQ